LPHCNPATVNNLRHSILSVFTAIALASCGDVTLTPWNAGGIAEARRVAKAEIAITLLSESFDPRVARFYQARGWTTAWSDEEASALLASMAQADRHGLDPDRFLRLAKLPGNRAKYDAGLTLAALTYGDALAHGLVDPATVHHIYALPRNKVDLVWGLYAALEIGGVDAWLRRLAPEDAEYEAISAAYVAAKNAGDEARAGQLAANLERRRWLSREVSPTRVDVNTAATFLTYVQDGQVAWQTKVITGHPRSPTPPLASPLGQIVVNPPWYVPPSIARNEILPKGAGYMRRANMYMRGNQIIQRPGPRSARGRIKFNLKNSHAIYLHDTPAKGLFAAKERHLSHGCVRVENPLELGRILTEASGKGKQFTAGTRSFGTRWIPLGREIPVRLLYHTAYLDGSGRLALHKDVYGWDARVARALEKDRGRPKLLASSVSGARLSP
jgi:murein L,D-transpeptidase YcbB/YkuD